MNDDRFLTMLVCDDVRQEIGNKTSYMGVYHDKLIVSRFPATLPKLCFVLTARTPAARPFRQLLFRVLRDDVTLAEFPLRNLERAPKRTSSPSAAPTEKSTVDVVFVAQVAGFRLDGPCSIKARAITEEGEIPGGSIAVEHAAQPS